MPGRRSAGDEVGRRVAHTGSLAMKTGNALTKATPARRCLPAADLLSGLVVVRPIRPKRSVSMRERRPMSDANGTGLDSYFAVQVAPAPLSTDLLIPTRTPRRWRRIVVAAVLLAGMTTAAAVQLHPPAGAAAGTADGGISFAKARPPVQHFSSPTRLLPAPVAPPGVGGWTALLTRNSAPVTWDPCQPIHFVVRPDGQIPSGRVMLDQVMGEISQATGLLFIDDGATTEAPSGGHSPYQPARYGKRWAPVLIAWTTPAEDPVLAGDVVGSAGPEATTIAGQGERIISGSVAFDAPDLEAQLAQPGGGVLVEQVMRHELGHIVGLGHVDDASQMMNPSEVVGVNDYGLGDRRGLAAMGSGRCFTKG
jgi:hypothetical protein